MAYFFRIYLMILKISKISLIPKIFSIIIKVYTSLFYPTNIYGISKSKNENKVLPGGVKKESLWHWPHFKKIGLNQWNHLDQHK